MRTLMMITIMVLMTTIMAKSEENKTVTPSELVTTLGEVPSKVSNSLKNEWQDIKEFQKTSWQEGKEQNAKNWAKIKSFFSNLTTGTN